eukprot:jgi/Hompol1/755/HPOL_001361-RA
MPLKVLLRLSCCRHDYQPVCQPVYRHNTLSPIWVAHKKHFFILSSAGKPIYSRYGDESKLSSLIGIIQAIISFYADDDDSLRSIRAGGHLFVFAAKGPLYLVAVSSAGESEAQLSRQLTMLFSQIALTLTTSQLKKVFQQRGNYDLRNLLSDTEIFMDNLCKLFQKDPAIFLESTKCLRMPPRMRDRILRAMSEASPPKQLLFGLVFARNELVSFLRPRNYTMHPSDVTLLLNLILSSTSFRTMESWIPVCLPQFNDTGFLYAYVWFITPDICMTLLSAEKDAFFALSEYKQRFMATFEAKVSIHTLELTLQASPFSITGASETYAAFGPLIDKQAITAALLELDKWIKSNEESLLMVQSAFIQ